MIEYGGSVYRTENESEKSPLVEAIAPLEEWQEVQVFGVQPTVAKSDKHNRMESAIGTSVVVGLLVGGPFFGILLGFGTAYAFDKVGAAGDAARAVGDVALFAKKKAVEVHAKHNVLGKISSRLN
jgi:hypothetical protein